MATRPTLAATIRVYGTTQRWCRSRRHPYRYPYIVRAPRGRTRGRQWPQKAVAVQLPYPAVGGLFGPLTFAPSLACLARPVHADKYIRPVARLERAGRDEQTGRARRERTGWTWNPTGRGAPVATPWWVRAGPSALRVTSSGVVVSCILLGIPRGGRRAPRARDGERGQWTPAGPGRGDTLCNAVAGPHGPAGCPCPLEWRRRIMHFAWNTARGSSRTAGTRR